MQVVIDTNVFVKGSVFKNSEERAVLKLIKTNRLTLLVTVPVVDEIVNTLFDVCQEYGYDPRRPQVELSRSLAASTLVHPPKVLPRSLRNPVPDDPEDNKFVWCAHYGNAEYIVSGDGHLLDISGKYKNAAGTPITAVKPYDFGYEMLRFQAARGLGHR